MNLKLIDAAIASYTPTLDQKDIKRLELFRSIWEEQETIRQSLATPWILPSQERLASLEKEGKAILSEAPIPIEDCALAHALEVILDVLLDHEALSEESAEVLREIDWSILVSSLNQDGVISNPACCLEDAQAFLRDSGCNEDAAHMGVLIVSLALKPFLEDAAERACKELDRIHDVAISHPLLCPVCGCTPSVSRVGGGAASKGRPRSLWCPQCGAIWAFDRVRCTRCGTRNQAHLHYYNIEGDESHRIATCDECGGYMRTVFIEEEKALVPFSFEVEDVVMARLDALAVDPSLACGLSREE